jgi:hypothetical protein
MSTLLPVNNIAFPPQAASGSVLATSYSNGTTAVNWAVPNSNLDTVMTVNNSESSPTLDVKGNLVINGVDLEERLRNIERVLTIPERDVILEKKHPKLKKLYNEYVNALAKYRTFEAIKGEDDAT